MKIRVLLLFSLLLSIGAHAQCGPTLPPPGLWRVYGLDTDNDGFAIFDIGHYIENIDRPEIESFFGVSSEGYNVTFYANNTVHTNLLYTNTSQSQICGLGYQYSGSGPEFEPQSPCYYPTFVYMDRGLMLTTVPFDGDYDNDGILNDAEDANRNRNLMDDDDDNDGIVNVADNENNLNVVEHDSIELNVFPNPVTNGIVTFESNVPILAATVYDLSGKQLFESKINSNTLVVDRLASGIYFLKILSEKGFLYRKIIVRN